MSSAATRSLPEDSDAPPAKRANTSSTAELESAKVEAPVKNNPSELSGGGEGDRVERKSGSTEKRSDSQTQTIAEPSDVFGVTAATHSHALDTPFIPKSESASNFNGGSISRAQTNRAKTQVSHEDESTSLIDCGIIQNGQRVYHVHEPYFGQTVEVFTAREDPHQRILFRPSLVAKKLNCHTSRVRSVCKFILCNLQLPNF